MDILIYSNRKQDPDMYDISTPEKEAATYLLLFKYLREDMQVYSDIDEAPDPLKICEACLKDLHRLCEFGDCACADTDECQKRFANTKSHRSAEDRQRALYQQALAGDAVAAKRLLQARKGHEYESFSLGSVIDPLEKQ